MPEIPGDCTPWRFNMTGVYWWYPWHTIYSSTMDPSWVIDVFSARKPASYLGNTVSLWVIHAFLGGVAGNRWVKSWLWSPPTLRWSLLWLGHNGSNSNFPAIFFRSKPSSTWLGRLEHRSPRFFAGLGLGAQGSYHPNAGNPRARIL